MNITVNVGEVDLNTVVGTHYRQTDEETYAEEPMILAELVAKEIVERLVRERDLYQPIRDRVKEIRAEEIRKAVRPEVEEALKSSIQKTDAYGQPKGEPSTLLEVVVAEAKQILTHKDRYDGVTLLDKAIKDAVTAAFRTEIAAEVEKLRKQVVAQFADGFAKQMTDAIAAGMRK